tara:strand:- start:11218 stop:11922 length:705 start_codon:yes stop_codon:yes gene_type:complete
MFYRRLSIAVAIVLFVQTSGRAEISSLSFNDFEDGTVQNWTRGNSPTPSNPINMATGGPDGIDDNYLHVAASGMPDVPGGRLVVTNSLGFGEEWTGDYIAAGIVGFSLDVLNLNDDVDLYMRMGLMSDQFAQTGFITPSFHLPAGSGWTNITFSIQEGDLVNDTGLAYADVFQSIETIRVYDNVLDNNYTGFIHGQDVAFGIDNVRALTAVPEPSTLGVLAMSGLLWTARRRRR